MQGCNTTSENLASFTLEAYDGTKITFNFVKPNGIPNETASWEFAGSDPDVDIKAIFQGNIWGSNQEIAFRYKGVLHRGYITFGVGGCSPSDDPYDPPTTSTSSTTTGNPNTTTTTTTTTNTTTPGPPTSCVDSGGTWVAFYVDVQWGANITQSGVLAWIEWYDPDTETTEHHDLTDVSDGEGNFLFAECIAIPENATGINYSVDIYYEGEKTVGEDYFNGNGQEGGGSGTGVPSGQYEGCAEFGETSGVWTVNECGTSDNT